ASDFGAVKFGDSIYFTSDRATKGLLPKTYKWTHRSFLDIYAVQDDQTTGIPSEAKPLPKSINSNLHEGNFCFSSDGMTLYISKSHIENGKKQFDGDGTNNIHLYETTFNAGKWSAPEKLPFNQTGF